MDKGDDASARLMLRHMRQFADFPKEKRKT